MGGLTWLLPSNVLNHRIGVVQDTSQEVLRFDFLDMFVWRNGIFRSDVCLDVFPHETQPVVILGKDHLAIPSNAKWAAVRQNDVDSRAPGEHFTSKREHGTVGIYRRPRLKEIDCCLQIIDNDNTRSQGVHGAYGSCTEQARLRLWGWHPVMNRTVEVFVFSPVFPFMILGHVKCIADKRQTSRPGW